MTDLESAVAELERRADEIETDEAWDALEPDLVHLRHDVFEAKVAARRAVEDAESKRSELGITSRLNPFDNERKRTARELETRQRALEEIAVLYERVQALRVRYWADRSQPFLRELVRRAEKIQRGVSAGWPAKAAAAAGALYAGLDGDAAIARANDLLEHPLAEDPHVLLAGFLGDRSPADAELFLAAAKRRGDAFLAAAWMVGDTSIDDAASLVRVLDVPAPIRRAAVASGRDKSAVDELTFALADRSPLVVAAAIACRRPADEVRNFLTERLDLEDVVAAHALFSDRAEDPAEVDRRVRAVLRAAPEAEATIRGAALRSRLPSPRCVALVDHLQQRLTGSWTSEATVIAAALLADEGGSDPARRAAALDPMESLNDRVVHSHTP